MQADPKKVIRYVNVAKGQLEGINKMISNDEYCIDISNQILAAIAVLNKANNEIITAHIGHCIKNAKGEEFDRKMEEISRLLKRTL
ncbi:MAG: metal-sensing transcriptional repressor [Erysipelotrichia bacterium]|jgi:DNA-binding FrmR family transcriptional regulator|nr:metal-sensing transcriptional repressor [Bacilli bacterium]NLB49401.1 metal-sensing transcriptional repressor [Erysipelotrichia bacterium]